MDWLVPSKHFLRRDRRHFKYEPNRKCQFGVIKIEGKDNVRQTWISYTDVHFMCSCPHSYRTK